MHLSLPIDDLAGYTAAQLAHLFPDGRDPSRRELAPHVRRAVERVEYCFLHIGRPGYVVGGHAQFDIYHADQYCTYLYYLSNCVHRAEGDPTLCKKLYALNKALNGFNCLYDVELPDIFCVVHGVGTVLGRAKYRNYLAVCHNTTIGAVSGMFPTMSEKLILSAGASLLGACSIGENVLLEPGCMLVKTDVPANTRVFGVDTHTFRPNTPRPAAYYFRLSDSEASELCESPAGAAAAEETR